MVYKNGFVKSQVTVSRGEQLTVGLQGVLGAGVVLENNSTALIKGLVLGQRGDSAMATRNGDGWDISIESTAVVTGSRGLYLEGSGGTLSNAGRILADGTAINIEGRNHNVSNSGSVEGELAINFSADGGVFVNEASGAITGEQLGIMASGSITNFGTISGGIAVRLYGYGSELVNKGEILGNIAVGAQDATLDMRGGQLNGVVRSEGRGTTVIVDNSDLRFVSTAGQAVVKASVDYALGNGVEKLVLTGTADIGGKANGENNALVGNDGNNTLRGMQGFDTLKGSKGDDTLTGGADSDAFIFESGDGHDIITDFQGADAGNRRDYIELGIGLRPEWQERQTFLDDHVRNDGQGNVIIEFEDQSITLLGLRKADLSLDDFRL